MIETLPYQQLGQLGLTNFLKHAVRLAVEGGVSIETVSLLLIFPLAISLIAAARYLIGIRGFGIFTPAMLAIAFLSTGTSRGIVLFAIILAIATLARLVTKSLRIHYLARMALLLWFICLGALVYLIWLPLPIFSVLILILLAETFIEVQIGKSLSEAFRVTTETFILAIMTLGMLQWSWLRRVVILQPELVVLLTAVFDLLIGRFSGLRLLEYRRFRRLLK